MVVNGKVYILVKYGSDAPRWWWADNRSVHIIEKHKAPNNNIYTAI